MTPSLRAALLRIRSSSAWCSSRSIALMKWSPIRWPALAKRAYSQVQSCYQRGIPGDRNL